MTLWCCLIMQVGESGWTESIPLEKKADQLNTKAVLIRARIPSWGTKHEVVARLELVGGGFARTMVLSFVCHTQCSFLSPGLSRRWLSSGWLSLLLQRYVVLCCMHCLAAA